MFRINNTFKCLLISTVMMSSISNIAGASESVTANIGQSITHDSASFSQVVPYGTGTWNYLSQSSTFTLSDGKITVYSNPGHNPNPDDGNNWVAVEVYIKSGNEFTLWSIKGVSGFKPQSVTFDGLTGTFYVKVYNFDDVLLPGTFTVVW